MSHFELTTQLTIYNRVEITNIRFKHQLTCKLTMVGAAAVEDISRIFLALGGSMGLRGVVGREDSGVTDAVEGVPDFLWLII